VRDRGSHGLVVGGVGAQGQHPAAAFAQPRGRRREPVGIAGQQGDLHPLGRQRLGDGESDAAAAAGYDRPLSAEK